MCCRGWRIEVITLDSRRLYRVTVDGVLVGRERAYVRTVGEVEQLLARYGGPALAEFEECE